MAGRATWVNNDAELMGDDIVGKFLSQQPQNHSSPTTGDQLRRFTHSQENLRNPRRLGCGNHGVVVLVEIKGGLYALKVFKSWKQVGPVIYPFEHAVYMSPLAKESQAFARLDALGENVSSETSSILAT
ncbi:hypothetical protein AYO21_00523 [Fonsecaea monophora]|uniref:Protein kinase domain-containing protein n=1 Tax=Fonsecaea monophora TaxID=254056 RepID=A0A177FLQ1_9EURO|nr:hypothetical protein AYO21_00523 [Fonsecaea monophora]OAG45175.1 hypothetical protein AYO21_00523 [Fonsecaea monophora]